MKYGKTVIYIYYFHNKQTFMRRKKKFFLVFRILLCGVFCVTEEQL